MNVHKPNTSTKLSISRLLEAQADLSPDSIAIAAPGRSPLSFSSLFIHAEGVVRTLNALGIGRHDRVAVVLSNGPEMAVAFLTVAAAATCAPLNPSYQANEFDLYFTDLKADALIIQAGMDSAAISVAQKRRIPILELFPTLEAQAGIFSLRGQERAPASRSGFAQAEDIALVLYTSGTTSRPKRVPLTHANLLASASHIRATLQLTEKDRCLNVMPLFHIHGLVGAVLASLSAGGSVICTSGFDTDQFFSWLEEFRPTWYTAVPAVHQAVLSCAKANGKIRKRCSLRFIRSSSAALPARVMQDLEEVFHVPVIEAYGMTEAAHQITSNPLPPGEHKAGSVGVPEEVEVAVMDEGGDLVSRGTAGEIVIWGENVMSGYENNPRANEESFRNGWFRTGDQGYFDADGYLFITGRLKEIINRGGEKVSLREIDEALLAFPGVKQAVAFPVPHPTLGEDIAAAVVLKHKDRASALSIREYLLERLADFKVPTQLLIVDQIPRGPTGKVHRIKLAAKFTQKLKREFVAPMSRLEAVVAKIYADVLGKETINTNDNFFTLGGDSLRATQVISRVRTLLLVNLPIVTVFRKATVAELAHEIARSMEAMDHGLKEEFLTELENAPQKDGREVLDPKLGRDPSSA